MAWIIGKLNFPSVRSSQQPLSCEYCNNKFTFLNKVSLFINYKVQQLVSTQCLLKNQYIYQVKFHSIFLLSLVTITRWYQHITMSSYLLQIYQVFAHQEYYVTNFNFCRFLHPLYLQSGYGTFCRPFNFKNYSMGFTSSHQHPLHLHCVKLKHMDKFKYLEPITQMLPPA